MYIIWLNWLDGNADHVRVISFDVLTNNVVRNGIEGFLN
jgi:hypothetical protein